MKLKIQDTPDSSTIEASRGYVLQPNAMILDPTLSHVAFRLYAVIGTYAWESIGTACWASQKTLAAKLGCSVSTVKRAADELLERGYITRQRTRGTNHYWLATCADELPDSSPVTHLDSSPVTYKADDIETDDRKHSPEPTSRETDGGGGNAREPEQTTTTTDLFDDVGMDEEAIEAANREYDLQLDTKYLLLTLDEIAEEETGRRPARREGDEQRARALMLRLYESGDEEATLTESLAPIRWGWRDEYSAKRLSNGIPTLAIFDGIAGSYAAIPKVGCQGCEERYTPSASERAAVKRCAAIGREAELICPECRKRYGMEQAA